MPRRTTRTLITELDQLSATATTDRDGRFHLEGVGRERYAQLNVTGAGMVYTKLNVITCDLQPIKLAGGNFLYPSTYLAEIRVGI